MSVFMRFAVMGYPVSHSLSPLLHHAFARVANVSLSYEKLEVQPDRFEEAVKAFFSAGGAGLNITAPFKKRAFTMSVVPSARAKIAGAANVLWMQDGVLYADTTDGIGFQRDLERFVDLRDKTVLLLGAGGAARSIWSNLCLQKPKQIVIANRTPTNASLFPGVVEVCTLSEIVGSFDVVVNALPLTLNDYASILSSCMENRPFCYDLNYGTQGVTPFVAFARTCESVAVDGFGMLVEQAVESFLIWQITLRLSCLI
jgi:shikimate dehydrogenase